MASQVTPPDDPDITQLLPSWSGGDRSAFDQVATVGYDESKRLTRDRDARFAVAGLAREWEDS